MTTQRLVTTTLAAAVLAASACLAQAQAPAQDTAVAKDAAPAAATAVKAQTKCPVMGGVINKKVFCDVQGKRIYFCCAGCIKTLQKDPAKYIKILEDQGVTIEKAPVPAPTDAAKAPAAEPAKAPAAAQ